MQMGVIPQAYAACNSLGPQQSPVPDGGMAEPNIRLTVRLSPLALSRSYWSKSQRCSASLRLLRSAASAFSSSIIVRRGASASSMSWFHRLVARRSSAFWNWLSRTISGSLAASSSAGSICLSACLRLFACSASVRMACSSQSLCLSRSSNCKRQRMPFFSPRRAVRRAFMAVMWSCSSWK